MNIVAWVRAAVRKKRLLLVALLALGAQSALADNAFLEGTASGNGTTTAYRVLEDAPTPRQRQRRLNLIYITWKFEHPKLANGEPAEEEEEAMQAFEASMQEMFAREVDVSGAILTAVLTSDTQRSWLYYTGSLTIVEALLRSAPAGRERPVEVASVVDPMWSTYFSVREGILRARKAQQP